MPLPVSQHSAGDSGHITDHNTLVAAVNEALTGRPFASANSYSARTESLFYDPETTTGWVNTNVFSVATDVAKFTAGTKSIRIMDLRMCWDNDPLGTSKAYVNLSADQTRGDWSYIAVDMWWTAGSGLAGDPTIQPGDSFQLFASENVDIGGTVSTAPIPPWHNAANTLRTIYIPVHNLSKVRCWGIRRRPDVPALRDHTAYTVTVWFDNVRWAEQTEIERARANGIAGVIPPSYSPGAVTKYLDVPSDQGLVDLRPASTVLANHGGFRYSRQFPTLIEDASGDARQALNDVFAQLGQGSHFVATPFARYRLDGTADSIQVRELYDVTLDFNQAAVIATADRNIPHVRFENCDNVTVRGLRVFGTRPTTTTGSTMVTQAPWSAGTVSGTTMQLNAQNKAARTSFSTKLARDVDGEAKVDVVLSDSAQVAGDCLVEFVDGLAPTAGPTCTAVVGGPLPAATYRYAITFLDEEGFETAPGPTTAITLASPGSVNLTNIPVAPARSTWGPQIIERRIYRTAGGDTDDPENLRMCGQLWDNTTTTFSDRSSEGTTLTNWPTPALTDVGVGNVETGSHRYAMSSVNATTGLEGPFTQQTQQPSILLTRNAQVSMNIPLGPAGTTERRIYRTIVGSPAGAGNLRFVGVVSDNTTTTFTDNVSDATVATAEVGPDVLGSGTLARRPPLLPRVYLTLTGTPTTYTIACPAEMLFSRDLGVVVRKATATANTITITSSTSTGRIGFATAFEAGSGLSIGPNCHNITFEDCQVENVGGDGIEVIGSPFITDVTMRHCVIRGARRQGACIVNGRAGTFTMEDGCEIRDTARQAIDIEPETNQHRITSIILRDLDIHTTGLNAISCAGSGAGWISYLGLERVRVRGVTVGSQATTSLMVAAERVYVDELEAPWSAVSIFARMGTVGSVVCKNIETVDVLKGNYDGWRTFSSWFAIAGPIVLTGSADPDTAITLETSVPMGNVVHTGRTQPQVITMPFTLVSGVPTDADFPFPPPDGTGAINQSTNDLYYRKAGVWTLMT